MASNITSSISSNSKIIRCKNCHQDILAEKMFLHEGFCLRNNAFCTHCQKVFLKKDFPNHLKNINSKNSEQSDQNINSPGSNRINSIGLYISPVITKRSPAYEYIEMPMTEQFKINKPIIISEEGQIVSNKNKNEYLLPYFGINNVQNNNITKEEFFNNNDETPLNQDEILKEIAKNNFNNLIEINGSMKNSLSMNDIHSHNKNIKSENFYFRKSQKINANNQQNNDNDILNDKNLNKSQSVNNIYNINNFGLKQGEQVNKAQPNINKDINNNINGINNIYNINDGLSNEKKEKNSNIIINNNIITYNSNNNIKKIHNYFAKKLLNGEFNQAINNNNNRKSLNHKPLNTQRDPYIDTQDFNLIYKKKNDPTDGKPRIKKNNNLSFDFSQKLKSIFDNIPKISKNHNDSKNICEFCKNYCDDLVLHYKYYHLKGNKGSIKPIKRDTALLNEKLNSNNIDEDGIDEHKRKILLREFRTTFHGVKNGLNNKNNSIFNLKSKITRNNKKFEKIKIVKKNIPDDYKKIEEVIRASDSMTKFNNKMKIPLIYNEENSRRQNSEGNIFNNTHAKNLNSFNFPSLNTQQINFYNQMDMYNPILSYSDIRNNQQINSNELVNYLNITN